MRGLGLVVAGGLVGVNAGGIVAKEDIKAKLGAQRSISAKQAKGFLRAEMKVG